MLNERQKLYLKNLSPEMAKKIVQIFPWEARGLTISQSVIKNIQSVDSELKVWLLGSLPLKIAGQRDIDLTGIAKASDFESHKLKLEKIFGAPTKINNSSMVWHFVKDGYEVGFYLIDPGLSDQWQRQRETNEFFKNNQALLTEYEQLKMSLNGVTLKKYQKKKFEFFNRILGK